MNTLATIQPHVEQLEIDFWQFFNLERALEDFEKHLAKQRESTRIAYRRDLRDFLDFTAGLFPDRSLVEDYVLHLRAGDKAPRTINRYLAAVKVFLRLLARQRPAASTIYTFDDPAMMYQLLQLQRAIDTTRDELIDASNIEGEQVIKLKEGHGVWLSEEECNYILASIDRTNLLGLRDYALLMVGLWTGLRVSEIQQLTFASFRRLSSGTYAVYTQGKRGKSDPVACDVRAFRAVEAYVEAYNAHFPDGDPCRINNPSQDEKGRWQETPTPLWRALKRNGKPAIFPPH